MKRKIKNILMVVLVGVFLFSLGKIVLILTEQYKENHAFEMLAKEVEDAREQSGGKENASDSKTPGNDNATEYDGSVENTKEEEKGKSKLIPRNSMQTDEETGILVPYLSLYERNQDLYGWISIEGTKVIYPVMYTPKDLEYYLRRAFDGSDADCGTPFLDAACSEEGNLYVVYGHRMKNRTMFGTLPYYEKKEYWEEHPYICFDTLYEQGTYEIVAAFYSKIYAEGESGFQYYDYKDLSSEEVFTAFQKGVEESALYETDETLSFGDTVLLLSTCSYHTSEGRFVVVAKKIM